MELKLYGFDLVNKYVQLPGFTPKPIANAVSVVAAGALLVASTTVLNDTLKAVSVFFESFRKSVTKLCTTRSNTAASNENTPPIKSPRKDDSFLDKLKTKRTIFTAKEKLAFVLTIILLTHPIAQPSFPIFNSITRRITPLTLG